MEQFYLGIDIGGTKTSLGLLDRTDRLVDHATMPSLPQNGCRLLTQRIGRIFHQLLHNNGLTPEDILSVGIASPGPLDLASGRIVHIPTMGFRDEPVLDYLKEALKLPAWLENDTNAAALCESLIGAGRGYRNVVYITISTGIGCGIAVNGRIIDGGAFAAGELGHLKAVRGGLDCPCGGKGCLEMYASGTSIARLASEKLGRSVDAKEAFALARQGSAECTAVIGEAADHLGYAIASVYQILDPDIIVLGGSVTKDYDFIEPHLTRAVDRYIQAVPGRTPRIAVSGFDGRQVLIGAALYGKMRYENTY